jgi:hypothetical protein
MLLLRHLSLWRTVQATCFWREALIISGDPSKICLPREAILVCIRTLLVIGADALSHLACREA